MNPGPLIIAAGGSLHGGGLATDKPDSSHLPALLQRAL